MQRHLFGLLTGLGGVAVALLSVAAAKASTLTINSFDNGWYQSDGTHTPINTNIIVGRDNPNLSYNNWFAFDLQALAGTTVISATLTTCSGNGQYNSPDPSETWGLFDYTSSISALLDGTGGVASFSDLGSGVSYGQATVSAPQNDPMPSISILLTSAAIADINALISGSQRFVVGGTLLSADPVSRNFLFGGS